MKAVGKHRQSSSHRTHRQRFEKKGCRHSQFLAGADKLVQSHPTFRSYQAEESFHHPNPRCIPMKTKSWPLLATQLRIAVALMFGPVLFTACNTVRVESSPPPPVLQRTVSGEELTSAEARKIRNPKTPPAETERLIKKGPHTEVVKQPQ